MKSSLYKRKWEWLKYKNYNMHLKIIKKQPAIMN